LRTLFRLRKLFAEILVIVSAAISRVELLGKALRKALGRRQRLR
jgi:hypothetical protein